MHVVVIGQGYVGLPLAVHAAEAGHRVVAYDTNTSKVKQLSVGETYIDDIPSDRIRRLLESGSLLPTADERDIPPYDVAVIAVPTPLTDGVPDLSHVESAAATLGRSLRHGAAVVLESTTYPGTTRNCVGGLLQQHSGLTAGEDFHLGFSPERTDPGNPHWHLANTPKLVAGIDQASLDFLSSFYRTFVDHVVPVSGCEEAEYAKLLENTFRHVNIALVNEMAAVAHDLGIDAWESLDAAATKPFGFMKFTPGPGVGGHCLPVDPQYLSWHSRRTLGRRSKFIELADEVNADRPLHVVRRITQTLNSKKRAVNGARVLLLGLSYKKNVRDTRESPALPIIRDLVRLGGDVQVADPHVPTGTEIPGLPTHGVTRVKCEPSALSSSDLTVLLTDHDSFDYAAVAAHSTWVLDCRRRLPALEHVEYL
ncbi:nucleotide sugar dehydrogenase [Streptomyces rubiginosohelvolus]|uniref:nucleotide sugar dehydrogenase n=1 Tax=Streptomyces rubiginosohelvolus TaxID=67362 RepID=UPI00367E834F